VDSIRRKLKIGIKKIMDTTILKRVANGELSVTEAAKLLHIKTGNKPDKPNFKMIYEEANQAGVAAAAACVPTPMVVQEHTNMLDDKSPVAQQWVVPAGVCGFAWIQFPGNTAWAKWAKANAGAHGAYPKGYSIWVHQFNQSMELKQAYAHAFVEVLRKYDIQAYAGSRMD
jgi:hypothetical protein